MPSILIVTPALTMNGDSVNCVSALAINAPDSFFADSAYQSQGNQYAFIVDDLEEAKILARARFVSYVELVLLRRAYPQNMAIDTATESL